jgi:hypothetical protein
LAKAQEVQLHNVFVPEDNTSYPLLTLETFKPDKLGNTFYFVDFKFDAKNSASLAYFEISREFTIKNKLINGLNFHIEYNDGLGINDENGALTSSPIGFSINRAGLIGFGFPVKIGNFTLNTTYMYKATKGSSGPDGQFTTVWHQNYFNNKFTFRGFLDIWSQDKELNSGGTSSKKAVILTQPQVMYNLNNSFSLGSEIEISNNFYYAQDKVKVHPSIMLRYVL